MDRLPAPVFMGFPGGSDGKESTCKAGNVGSIHGLGRSPGRGPGNPLQYSCLESPWTEELRGIQSMGSQRVNMTEQLSTAQHSKYFTSFNLRNPESPRGHVLVYLCQRENQAEELRVLPAKD